MKRSSGTSGDRGRRGASGGARQVVKQVRSGENQRNKEKSVPWGREKETKHKHPSKGGEGRAAGPGTSIVSVQPNQERMQSRLP